MRFEVHSSTAEDIKSSRMWCYVIGQFSYILEDNGVFLSSGSSNSVILFEQIWTCFEVFGVAQYLWLIAFMWQAFKYWTTDMLGCLWVLWSYWVVWIQLCDFYV